MALTKFEQEPLDSHKKTILSGLKSRKKALEGLLMLLYSCVFWWNTGASFKHDKSRPQFFCTLENAFKGNHCIHPATCVPIMSLKFSSTERRAARFHPGNMPAKRSQGLDVMCYHQTSAE